MLFRSRGVNCDYTVQKLLEKELIVISGRNEKMPGQPLLYSTSRSFMDYFGLNTSEDLPRIKEIIATELSEPTFVNELQLQDTVTEEETSPAISVTTEDAPSSETE